MKHFLRFPLSITALFALVLTGCDKDDMDADNFDTSGSYTQNDQMARPAVNTVFVNSARKMNSTARCLLPRMLPSMHSFRVYSPVLVIRRMHWGRIKQPLPDSWPRMY